MPNLPKFLYADDLSSTRHFLIHTEAPRFLAEIADETEDEGILDEMVLVLGGGLALFNMVWFDRRPSAEDLIRLCGQARRFLDDYIDATDLMTEDGGGE
jgi:hypothetical protein